VNTAQNTTQKRGRLKLPVTDAQSCHAPVEYEQPGLPTEPVFNKKSQILSQKKPDSSLKALTHKICITKHKTDVKTR